MKRTFNDIGVDAGLIMIFDKDLLEKYGGLREDHSIQGGVEFELNPGEYICNWEIKNTWNGDVASENIPLTVTSGKLLCIDPCYVISDWDRFLNDTDFVRNHPYGTVVMDKMGGDGVYDVTIEITRR